MVLGSFLTPFAIVLPAGSTWANLAAGVNEGKCKIFSHSENVFDFHIEEHTPESRKGFLHFL